MPLVSVPALRRRLAIASAVALLVTCIALPSRAVADAASTDPAITAAAKKTPAKKKPKVDVRLRQRLFADPRMHAAVAAKTDRRFAALGTTPQAFWVTDRYAVRKVKKVMVAYAARAAKKKRTPVVALYGIPQRDCGSHSSGGFTPAAYKAWVRQIAAGLKGKKAIAILEPDAVAQLYDCPQGDRAGLLRYAAGRLTKAGIWVYIDAGHSGWRTPADMAARLRLAGIATARGFSTNVGSYQYTAAEVAYAEAVAAELAAAGLPGKHYVVETARNGAGPAPDNEFCNPPHARIGASPRIVAKGLLDAYVWVKHPGESDGACHGGPPSGVWWPAGALRLLGKA